MLHFLQWEGESCYLNIQPSVHCITPRSFAALVVLNLMENEWVCWIWYEILNLYSRWHFINYMPAKSWRTQIFFSKDVCSNHKKQLGCHSWGKSQEDPGSPDLLQIWFWFHKPASAWTGSCIHWVHKADADRMYCSYLILVHIKPECGPLCSLSRHT